MAKPKSDRKHLLSAGALVVAVVGTLILGWVLQGESAQDDFATVVELTATDHEPDSSAAADVEPPPALPPAAQPTPEPDALVARSTRDLDRMASVASGWTLQFMSACDEGNVRARLAALQSQDDFYLIPVTLDGSRCFRLCWGIFETKERALSGRAIPAALAAINDKPLAISIDKVIR